MTTDTRDHTGHPFAASAVGCCSDSSSSRSDWRSADERPPGGTCQDDEGDAASLQVLLVSRARPAPRGLMRAAECVLRTPGGCPLRRVHRRPRRDGRSWRASVPRAVCRVVGRRSRRRSTPSRGTPRPACPASAGSHSPAVAVPSPGPSLQPDAAPIRRGLILDAPHVGGCRLQEFQLVERQRGVSDHICGRGRDRRLGQISWSLTPRLPSVSRAGQPCAYRAAEGAARILRSETTGPAGVTALKRCRTDFGIGHPDRQGRCQEGEHPAQRPVPPFVPLSAWETVMRIASRSFLLDSLGKRVIFS